MTAGSYLSLFLSLQSLFNALIFRPCFAQFILNGAFFQVGRPIQIIFQLLHQLMEAVKFHGDEADGHGLQRIEWEAGLRIGSLGGTIFAEWRFVEARTILVMILKIRTGGIFRFRVLG